MIKIQMLSSTVLMILAVFASIAVYQIYENALGNADKAAEVANIQIDSSIKYLKDSQNLVKKLSIIVGNSSTQIDVINKPLEYFEQGLRQGKTVADTFSTELPKIVARLKSFNDALSKIPYIKNKRGGITSAVNALDSTTKTLMNIANNMDKASELIKQNSGPAIKKAKDSLAQMASVLNMIHRDKIPQLTKNLGEAKKKIDDTHHQLREMRVAIYGIITFLLLIGLVNLINAFSVYNLSKQLQLSVGRYPANG